MGGYELVLSEGAALVFVAASRTDQRKLMVILDDVKAAPPGTADLQERDAEGRVNDVLVFGDWLVTYWVDHAVREVRIVRLEHVED